MRVVKEISTGEIKYRQEPDFADGFGIKNALELFGGTSQDYVEVEITQHEWDVFVASLPK